jgi:hypothetical protein
VHSLRKKRHGIDGQQAMKTIKNILLLPLLLVVMGCEVDININDHIDKNAPLKLTVHKRSKKTGFTSSNSVEIAAFSDKYKKLIEWGNNNTSGWGYTPASYVKEISVVQKDFRMLYTTGSNGVTIGFTDAEGNPKQYRKMVNAKELDFLSK